MTSGRRRAFTLLEVMAALLIMATAIFALLQIQSQNVARTILMGEQARALSLAETAMDQFLASPELNLAGDVFADDTPVNLKDFDTEGLRVQRIITEHVPLDEQESIYVNPDEEPYYPLTEEEAKEKEENPFDPGKFVAVRIEVWRSTGEPRLLATLETWLPRPMTEEEAAEAGITTGTTSPSGAGGTGTTGSGGTGSGTGTGGGRTGTGGGRTGTGTGTGGGRTGTGGANNGGGGQPGTGGGTRPPTGGGTGGTPRPSTGGNSPRGGSQGGSGR